VADQSGDDAHEPRQNSISAQAKPTAFLVTPRSDDLEERAQNLDPIAETRKISLFGSWPQPALAGVIPSGFRDIACPPSVTSVGLPRSNIASAPGDRKRDIHS
jgi:hypothetical protein